MKKFQFNIPVRFKNKAFWIAFIPAVIILIQAVGNVFGFTIDLSEMQGKLLDVVDAVFVLLAILGIFVDFTTEGFGDSNRVMGYNTPGAIDSGFAEYNKMIGNDEVSKENKGE